MHFLRSPQVICAEIVLWIQLKVLASICLGIYSGIHPENSRKNPPEILTFFHSVILAEILLKLQDILKISLHVFPRHFFDIFSKYNSMNSLGKSCRNIFRYFYQNSFGNTSGVFFLGIYTEANVDMPPGVPSEICPQTLLECFQKTIQEFYQNNFSGVFLKILLKTF